MDNAETINAYRACFMTDAGHRVLGHLILESKLLDRLTKDSDDVAVQNFVKKILWNCGVNPINCMPSFVNKLFELGIE